MTVLTVDRSHDGVALVTLDRPEARNAMDAEMIAGLHDTFEALHQDRSCRVVVLTGAGAGFCAGLDLKAGATPPAAEGLGRAQAGLATQQSIANLVPRMRSMRPILIAAVNGAASGGGFALALACDIRLAAASARFNVAFVRVGLSGCDIGVSWLLPRLIGASRAYELMLTGRFVDAAEAERIGLVARVVSDGEVVAAALDHAELHPGQQPLRGADDQGGHVEPARGGQPHRRHRPGEPHPVAGRHHRRSGRGHGRLRREAPAPVHGRLRRYRR